MRILFNADEVLAIAIQMEDNAAAFYRRCAELHPGVGQAYLLTMAAMEDDHRRTFQRMREDASRTQDRPAVDLDPEGALYLAAIAGGYRVEGSPAVTASLTGRETLREILALSLELEKEAVLFYLGLRDAVPRHLGRDRIEAVIGEEKKHIVTLWEALRSLPSAA